MDTTLYPPHHQSHTRSPLCVCRCGNTTTLYIYANAARPFARLKHNWRHFACICSICIHIPRLANDVHYINPFILSKRLPSSAPPAAVHIAMCIHVHIMCNDARSAPYYFGHYNYMQFQQPFYRILASFYVHYWENIIVSSLVATYIISI